MLLVAAGEEMAQGKANAAAATATARSLVPPPEPGSNRLHVFAAPGVIVIV